MFVSSPLRAACVLTAALAAGACNAGNNTVPESSTTGSPSTAGAGAEGSGTPTPAAEGTAAAEGTPAAEEAVAQNDTQNADPTAAPADVAAPPADAQLTASGLASKVIRAGTGTENPRAADSVTVHYAGWTTDGEMFDSSYPRNAPATFPLNRVIAGWTEGVQLMVVGEKRRFWIPQDLAYRGQPGAPAGMLVFDVELLEIARAPEPPATPPDVAGPPADAEVTASGLASKVLQAGTGETRPTATSTVEVHYSGWTTDGNMFDSSIVRGRPATFPLNGVIAGWTEGVALMVVGEKRRFWIPENLAYGGQPGRPAGMLVFDVELLSIR